MVAWGPAHLALVGAIELIFEAAETELEEVGVQPFMPAARRAEGQLANSKALLVDAEQRFWATAALTPAGVR